MVFHFKFLCEIFHSTPVGDKFWTEKIRYTPVAKNIKPRGAISNIPKRCNPFSSAMLLTEYLLMFLLVCKHLKHGGKRKEYKNFDTLFLQKRLRLSG
jgi:hypothetical protein